MKMLRSIWRCRARAARRAPLPAMKMSAASRPPRRRLALAAPALAPATPPRPARGRPAHSACRRPWLPRRVLVEAGREPPGHDFTQRRSKGFEHSCRPPLDGIDDAAINLSPAATFPRFCLIRYVALASKTRLHSHIRYRCFRDNAATQGRGPAAVCHRRLGAARRAGI